MKKKLFVFFLIFMCELGFAKQVILGGKEGWPKFQEEKNIAKGKGRFGYDCIQLSTNSFEEDIDTDLLIDFENSSMPISYGEYQITSNNLIITTQTKMEKQAGLSRNIGGMNLLGSNGTFFGTRGLHGSFSIDFWLCPSIAENGEVIMNWESSRNINGLLIYQLINCSFSKGHLVWTFTNVFDGYMEETVVIEGSSKIIPDKWTYHSISFDSENGELAYYVNGVTEDIKYITSTKREDGQVYLVYLGEKSELELCKEYTGRIDEIRILRRPYALPDYQSPENAGNIGRLLYAPTGGRFVTKPIVVSNGAKLKSIVAQTNIPSQTEVSFFVRSGDNYFNWNNEYPKWKAVKTEEELKNISGLYFQLACELYPDGDGLVSPTITQVTLDFEELSLPNPPFTVKAKAGNKCVTLSWSTSVDNSCGGYYVYYGTRPGEYLGRFAIEGNSPINVGNITSFTITGLENGKIYYFAIASWSSYDDRIIGPVSKEVFARPLERLQ